MTLPRIHTQATAPSAPASRRSEAAPAGGMADAGMHAATIGLTLLPPLPRASHAQARSRPACAEAVLAGESRSLTASSISGLAHASGGCTTNGSPGSTWYGLCVVWCGVVVVRGGEEEERGGWRGRGPDREERWESDLKALLAGARTWDHQQLAGLQSPKRARHTPPEDSRASATHPPTPHVRT